MPSSFSNPDLTNPTFDASNNCMASGQNWTYDSAGNVTGDPEGRTLIYDAENKQVKVETLNENGSAIAPVGEYFYNGDELRIKKVVPGTGETTIFVYDASNKLVAEYSTVAKPAAIAKTSYLTTDHLGSPRVLTDQFGQVISRRDFHPFGEEISTAERTAALGYQPDKLRQKFTGYERDAETDLDFAQARMHNYNLGRFTSPDSMMASARRIAPQTFNRYTYSLNSPLRYVDPSGLIACPPEDPECYTDEDGELKTGPIQVENEKTSVPGCGGKVTDECAKYAPQGPAAGFVGPPPPPVVAPGSPAPVTAPPPDAALSVGRTILSNVGRAVLVAALAPAAIILAAPVTVQAPGPAPAGQTLTTTTTTDESPADRREPVYVGLGQGPETQESLGTQAAAAQAAGFPHGVSVLLFSNAPPGSRSAPVSIAEAAFEIRQTENRPNHYTVILPNPVTPETTTIFNKVFVPR